MAAAGGAVAAAHYLKAATAEQAQKRSAEFDQLASKGTQRQSHKATEFALGSPEAESDAKEVEVEHFPCMHIRDSFPDSQTWER